MESLDKLSIIEENYEEQITSSEFNESSNKTVGFYYSTCN